MTQQLGDESGGIATWLYSTLTGDASLLAWATGGVHDTIAPLDAGYPRVVFDMLSLVDVRAQGADRIMVESVWLVKAIVQEPSYSNAGVGFGHFDRLLDGQPNQATVAVATDVGGVDVLTSTRDGVLRLPETVDAVEYRHLGGRYRIRAQIST